MALGKKDTYLCPDLRVEECEGKHEKGLEEAVSS